VAEEKVDDEEIIDREVDDEGDDEADDEDGFIEELDVTRVLTQGTANHLQVCPVLGRNSAPHDAVRDALSHLVVQNGITDAAVVETLLTAGDGSTFDADVFFFDPSSRARVILEVSIVTIGSDTSLPLGRCARAGLDGVNAQLRAHEEDKRNHSVVQMLLNEAGNHTIVTPIIMSACGAMGPSMAFLKEVRRPSSCRDSQP
jgi:hypothetical protein